MRILVTGASSGIGEATVRALVKEGHEVVATARRAQRLEKLHEQTGATVIPADLTKPEDVTRLVEQAGNIDALVNNAGGARGSDPVATGKLEDWQAMYELNVLATRRSCLRFARRMARLCSSLRRLLMKPMWVVLATRQPSMPRQ